MAEVRWHINGNGVAGRCSAQPGNCPVSPNAPHFPTAAAARSAYEDTMEADAVATPARKPKPMSPEEAAERKTVRKAAQKIARRAGDGGVGHGVTISSHGYSGHGRR